MTNFIPDEQLALHDCICEVVKSVPEPIAIIAKATGIRTETLNDFLSLKQALSWRQHQELFAYFRCEYNPFHLENNYIEFAAGGQTLYPKDREGIIELYDSITNGGDTVFAIHLINNNVLYSSSKRYILVHTCIYSYSLLIIEGLKNCAIFDRLINDGELINFLGDRIACDGFWRELEHHEQLIKDKPENRRILDAKFFNPQNWLLFEQVSVSYPPKNVRHFVS